MEGWAVRDSKRKRGVRQRATAEDAPSTSWAATSTLRARVGSDSPCSKCQWGSHHVAEGHTRPWQQLQWTLRLTLHPSVRPQACTGVLKHSSQAPAAQRWRRVNVVGTTLNQGGMGSNAQPLWAPGLSAHFWDTFWKLRDPGRVKRPVTTAGTQQQTLVSPPSLSHPPHTSLLLPGIPTPVTACSRGSLQAA